MNGSWGWTWFRILVLGGLETGKQLYNHSAGGATQASPSCCSEIFRL